jgi:hypothetical protein
MAARDGFFITKVGERWAAIYGITSRFDVPPDLAEKYLFDTVDAAITYANRNYTTQGLIMDPALEGK